MNESISHYTEADIEMVCSTLHTISNQYRPGTSEALALKDAAAAFIFIVQHRTLKSAFENSQAMAKQLLGPTELEHLKSMGIET